MKGLLVSKLLKEKKDEWKLQLLAGKGGLKNEIKVHDISRPGLFLAGFGKYFEEKRPQVFGLEEIAYIKTLEPGLKYERLEAFFRKKVPVLFITHNLKPPAILLKLARSYKVPVISTPLSSTEFIGRLSLYLGENLAPSVTRPGTLVEVYGLGVLLTGPSGIGKSECALDLISRGHALVADDVVKIINYPAGVLTGTSVMEDVNMRYYMEIRGIGLVDIPSLFGVHAVREKQKIDIHVELARWTRESEPERLGIEEGFTEILGVKLLKKKLFLNPGKNIGVLIETIALSHLLKQKGKDMAILFARRLKEKLKE